MSKEGEWVRLKNQNLRGQAYLHIRRVLVQKKCYESNYKLKYFFPENFFPIEFVGKILPLPSPLQKHGIHDTPAILPFSAVFKKHHRNL
jgi:hypothetical protein